MTARCPDQGAALPAVPDIVAADGGRAGPNGGRTGGLRCAHAPFGHTVIHAVIHRSVDNRPGAGHPLGDARSKDDWPGAWRL